MQRPSFAQPRVLTALGLTLALGAGTARSEEPQVGSPSPLTLEALQKLVQDQQTLIARQQAALDGLEKRLTQVESRVGAGQQAPPQPSPSTDVPASVEERLSPLEKSAQKRPEFLESTDVSVFPGSFRIPGTKAAS